MTDGACATRTLNGSGLSSPDPSRHCDQPAGLHQAAVGQATATLIPMEEEEEEDSWEMANPNLQWDS